MKIIQLPLALSFLVAGAAPALAADDARQGPDAQDGIGYVGGTLFLRSEYPGSDETELMPLPYLSFQNVEGFDLFGTTLSYRALETGTGEGLGKWSLRAGPSLQYQGGRDSEDSPALTGLEDIGGSVIAGGYVRSTIGPVGLQFNAGQDIAGGHGGFTADASVGTFLPLGALKIQPSATASWGSGDHNASFFGITPAQSSASGLGQYDIGSGIYAYSVNVVSWVEVSDNWVLTAIGSHRWFTGDATDSPILLAPDGSDTGIFAAIGVARKFDTNKW